MGSSLPAKDWRLGFRDYCSPRFLVVVLRQREAGRKFHSPP